jgi:hypothetical protein
MLQITSDDEKQILTTIFTKNVITSLSLDNQGWFVVQKLFKVYEETERENLSLILIDSMDVFLGNQNAFRMVNFF